MRIGVLELPGHGDLRQNLRAHLDVDAFCPLDLLPRNLNRGILSERREDRLIERKPRNRSPPQTHFSKRFSSRKKKRGERHEGQKRGAEREVYGGFSHGWKTADGQVQVGDGAERSGLRRCVLCKVRALSADCSLNCSRIAL